MQPKVRAELLASLILGGKIATRMKSLPYLSKRASAKFTRCLQILKRCTSKTGLPGALASP
jgi:hypothetical protein